MHQSRCLLALTICVLLTSAVHSYTATQQYIVTDLGAFFPSAINNAGMTAGSVADASGTHAAIYQSGVITALGVPGAAYDLTDDGVVVGTSVQDGSPARPFRWHQTTGIEFLPVPPHRIPEDYTATGVCNDCPEELIVGLWFPPVPQVNPICWHNQQLEILSAPAGSAHSATWRGDHVEIVRSYVDPSTNTGMAAVWKGCPSTEVRVVGRISSGPRNPRSGFLANNQVGQRVGWTYTLTTGSFSFALLHDDGHGLQVLPGLTPTYEAQANAINDHGVIVGMSWPQGDRTQTRAVRWTATPITGPEDLNDLIDPASGWHLMTATAITEDGRLVGTGLLHGQPRGYLLTPMPSLALRLHQTTFRPGETLRVDVHATNPGQPTTTDFYLAVLLPDGVSVLFITNLAPLDGIVTTLSAPHTFRPLAAHQRPVGDEVSLPDFFTYTFHGLETPGTYHLIVALTPVGAFNDDSIDEGDILALDREALHFSSGASQALYGKMQSRRARHLTQASPALSGAE